MTALQYHPDFSAECRLCGTSPCVLVVPHREPDTSLCGPHFFSDRLMIDWSLWNEDYLNSNS